jgi:hypothetical protein
MYIKKNLENLRNQCDLLQETINKKDEKLDAIMEASENKKI